MKIKYTKSFGYKNLSPQESKVVATELRKIQQEQSVVTPRIVVDVARRHLSPLHKYFEWDDTVAAQRHREWQARALITSVFIVNAEDPKAQPIRAFVNCSPTDDEGEEFMADRGYVFTPSISGRQSYEAQVLQYAKNQLLSWRKKFGNYQQFFGVVKEIDSLK